MTFRQDEGSTEHSQPREGIEFILPMQTWRHAVGTRDITINGNVFTAFPTNREELALATAEHDASELVVMLPMSHPVVQRWNGGGVPPKTLLVNCYRKQVRSGAYEIWYRGYVESLGSEDGRVAKFLVPSRFGKVLSRKLPVITTSRNCPHFLYDRNCRVPRSNTHRILTTVQSFNGAVVKSAAALSIDVRFGELVHIPSGERMSIHDMDVTANTVTIQLPIYGMNVGDAIELWRGCKHTILDCRMTFDNKVNFGGFPQMNTRDIFKPTGYGIRES